MSLGVALTLLFTPAAAIVNGSCPAANSGCTTGSAYLQLLLVIWVIVFQESGEGISHKNSHFFDILVAMKWNPVYFFFSRVGRIVVAGGCDIGCCTISDAGNASRDQELVGKFLKSWFYHDLSGFHSSLWPQKMNGIIINLRFVQKILDSGFRCGNPSKLGVSFPAPGMATSSAMPWRSHLGCKMVCDMPSRRKLGTFPYSRAPTKMANCNAKLCQTAEFSFCGVGVSWRYLICGDTPRFFSCIATFKGSE